MLLCLQQLQWWFSWSLVWVFTSAPPHGLSSLPLYPLFRVRVLHLRSSPSCSHMWSSHLILFWVHYWAPNLCHASCLYHTFHSHSWFTFRLFYFMFYHVMHGSHSKSRPRHQRSSFNTGRFILDFEVHSSAKYNTITKEEKDPQGLYAINTCSTKLLSSKWNLYMHWNCTNP